MSEGKEIRELRIGPWRYIWTNINPVTGESHRTVGWWSTSSDIPVTEQIYDLLSEIDALREQVKQKENALDEISEYVGEGHDVEEFDVVLERICEIADKQHHAYLHKKFREYEARCASMEERLGWADRALRHADPEAIAQYRLNYFDEAEPEGADRTGAGVGRDSSRNNHVEG